MFYFLVPQTDKQGCLREKKKGEENTSLRLTIPQQEYNTEAKYICRWKSSKIFKKASVEMRL